MIFSFFVPETKVHKQRNIMRIADSRLARFSLLGLGLHVVVFIVSMALGQFYYEQPILAYVLGGGIILTTIFRAYYSIRFESIYPRAPEAWRNKFFWVTLMGALWWGGMLATVTYFVGMYNETALLWLYTIAFFSSCSHAFSPYKRFYLIYLSLVFIPSSIIALVSLNALESVYGLIMLILYFLMRKQGINQGDSYWDRLQANYDLTQKAHALQAEKISSESTLINRDNLFTNLAGELKTSLREIMGSLELLKLSKLPEQEEQLVDLTVQKSQQQMHMLKNILDYSHISRKEIVLEQNVLDVRSLVENTVTSISDRFYKKNIEVLSQFSQSFPLRVSGDAERIEQIIVNMMVSAIDYCDKGSMLLELNYLEGIDNSGTLKVVINLDKPLRNIDIEQDLHDAFKPHYASNMSQGLSLAIAKGLATCMQGNAGANYTANGHLKFWFTIVLPLVTRANKDTQALSKFNGKRVLLFEPPQIIENEYRENLETWGFSVDICYDSKDLIKQIQTAQVSTQPYELLIIYTYLNNFEGFTLSQEIAQMDETFQIKQLLCMTLSQSKLPEVIDFVNEHPLINLILKPLSYKHFKKRLKNLIILDDQQIASTGTDGDFLKDKHVMLYQKEEIDRTIAEVTLKKLGCLVTIVESPKEIEQELTTKPYDAFITESEIADLGISLKEFLESVRVSNQKLHANGYRLPVLGLSHHEIDGAETLCLQSGMNYYIELPLQIDDLQAILRRWIGRATHLAETR